ncbi:MAG: hypothetical protein Kow0081_2340 [Candidatus Dojkabacteria bacterium]
MEDIEKFYQRKEYFEFNLLPKVSKEEIEILNERDNTLLYSFILIFSAVVVYFVLTLLSSFVLSPRINTLERRVLNLDQRIDKYDEIRRVNGEIVRKSKLLEKTLEKDIELKNFFNISEQITSGVSNPTGYKRNADGRFEIRFRVNSYNAIDSVFNTAKSLETIDEVRLESILRPSDSPNAWEATLSFRVLND